MQLQLEAFPVFEALKSCEIFRDLTQLMQLQILSSGHLKQFRAGEVIYEAGQPSSYLYFVIKGSIELSMISPAGKEISVALIYASDVFGDIGFVDGKPRETTAVCLSNAETFYVGRADFITHMDKMTLISWLKFLSRFCQQNRELVRKLENATLLNPQHRLVRKLLELGESSKAIVISHEKLASMLGIARESVSKHLAELESRKLISKRRGTVLLDNPRGLRILDQELSDGTD